MENEHMMMNKISRTDILKKYMISQYELVYSNEELKIYITKISTHRGKCVVRSVDLAQKFIYDHFGKENHKYFVDSYLERANLMENNSVFSHFVPIFQKKILNNPGERVLEMVMPHSDFDILKLASKANLQIVHNWFTQCVNALSALEINDLFHGNLQPHNVLVDTDDRIMITDLGKSLQLQNITEHLESLTTDGIQVELGFNTQSQAFAAPEILQYYYQQHPVQERFQKPVIQSDVYSLAICFWVVLNFILKTQAIERKNFFDYFIKILPKIRLENHEEFEKMVQDTKVENNQDFNSKFMMILSKMILKDKNKRPKFINIQKALQIYNEASPEELHLILSGKSEKTYQKNY
jgi:serine/threonine protein kinase